MDPAVFFRVVQSHIIFISYSYIVGLCLYFGNWCRCWLLLKVHVALGCSLCFGADLCQEISALQEDFQLQVLQHYERLL